MEEAGANRFAKPNVGQSHMVATVGTGPRNPDGTSRGRDHASGQDRDLGWR